MTAAEVYPPLPGWAEPDGILPRPRSRWLRNCGASLVALGMFGTVGIAAAAPSTSLPASLQSLHVPVEGKCWFTDTWHDPRPGGRVHEGLDIGADAGVPIYAVADGTISRQYFDHPGWRGGNAIRLTLADGTYFFYGHMSGFAEGIAIGVPVTAGTVIGFVGMTGNAGVNHLHLEVHPNGGEPIDPYPIARQLHFCEQTGTPKAAPVPTTGSVAVILVGGTDGSVLPAPTDDPAASTSAPGILLVPVVGGDLGCVAKYVVQNGDYWYFVAAATKIRASLLAAANNRTIESFIYPAESLCVPDLSWRPATPPPPALHTPTAPRSTGSTGSTLVPVAPVKCAQKYTVRAGDYWYMLASWFQIRASRLATANRRTTDSAIYAGESLCIPF